MRPKIDWDYVEWLLDELRGQLGPKIATVRSKREKNRISTAESRKDPEVARKHREYNLRYNNTRRLELARKRAERRLAEIENMEANNGKTD